MIMLVAAVVPWPRWLMCFGSSFRLSMIWRTPVWMASDGSCGVDGTLKNQTLASASPKTVKSVNVPPTSTPMRYISHPHFRPATSRPIRLLYCSGPSTRADPHPERARQRRKRTRHTRAFAAFFLGRFAVHDPPADRVAAEIAERLGRQCRALTRAKRQRRPFVLLAQHERR